MRRRKTKSRAGPADAEIYGAGTDGFPERVREAHGSGAMNDEMRAWLLSEHERLVALKDNGASKEAKSESAPSSPSLLPVDRADER